MESDIRGYCFEAPGTVPINPAALKEVREAEKQGSQQKRQHTAHKHGRH